MTSDKNKRVAKNALALYIRMFIQLLVGLYTSRALLDALGVDNYGIYNIVGGFVTMFTFMRGALSQGTQRFITYYMGEGDYHRVGRVFCMGVNIYIIFCITLFVILEIIGIFFLETSLNLPASRVDAAQFVYQCSVFSLITTLMSTPYNALIIAHEDMKAFAYIDLLHTFLNLVVCYLLYISPFDTLKVYAVLVLVINLGIRFLYTRFCRKHYAESKFHIFWDQNLFKEMISFSGWVTLSSISETLRKQGQAVVINKFFGVVANASMGVANHVNAIVNKFASNLQTAFLPQLVKSYAEGNKERTRKIVFSGAKICCIIIMFFAIPVNVESHFLLNIWLKKVPDYTEVILAFVMLEQVLRSMTYSMNSAIRATGKIARYEVTLNVIMFVGFGLSVVSLYLYPKIWVSLLVQIIFVVFYNLYIIFSCGKVLNFTLWQYLSNVCIGCALMGSVALGLTYMVKLNMDEGLLRLMLVLVVSTITFIICLHLFVLTKDEKQLLYHTIKKRSRKS